MKKIISILSDNLESTIVIFSVIILNAVLGTLQHFKAEKSLEDMCKDSWNYIVTTRKN